MKTNKWAIKLQKWQERRNKLYKLHEQGASISDLARQEGITERSINILLRKVKNENQTSISQT